VPLSWERKNQAFGSGWTHGHMDERNGRRERRKDSRMGDEWKSEKGRVVGK
jgi:hypothetical protein